MAAVLRKKCRFSLYDSTSSWMTRIFLHYDVKLTNPMMMCYASMSASSCPPPPWTWLSSSFCRYSCLKNKLNGNHLIVKINHINHMEIKIILVQHLAENLPKVGYQWMIEACLPLPHFHFLLSSFCFHEHFLGNNRHLYFPILHIWWKVQGI